LISNCKFQISNFHIAYSAIWLVTACFLQNEPTSLTIPSPKPLRGGSIAKASVKSAKYDGMFKTRSVTSLPWPGWTLTKVKGRSEPVSRAILWDELW